MDPESSSIKRLILHNKGTKIAALFTAFVTWYVIQTVINYEVVVTDVPLVIQADAGWAVLDRSAYSVDVRFRGSQEDIRYLSRDQVKVEVDIRGHSKEGSSTVRLRPRNVKAPGAVRVVLLRPDELTLRLDQEGEKQVPIKADFQGTPSEGSEVEKVVCTPAMAIVSAPRQRLDEVSEIRTAPIDLEGRTRPFKKLRVPLTSPSETWVAHIVPSNVMVEITLVERAGTQDLPDVPVALLFKPGPRPKVELWPERVIVTLKGNADRLRSVEAKDLSAYVDCTALQGGASFDLPVQVQAPAGFSVVRTEPPTVKVTTGAL